MNRLVPFEPVQNINVSADFIRHNHEIHFLYSVSDPQTQIIESLVAGQWSSWPREDELWRTTCLEAFFGVRGEPGYWELNLSPARQLWNLYWFDDYRVPQPPTPCMDFKLIGVRSEADRFEARLTTELELGSLEAALCAVIRTKAGVNYFALDHGPKPDFHRRQGFLIKP